MIYPGSTIGNAADQNSKAYYEQIRAQQESEYREAVRTKDALSNGFGPRVLFSDDAPLTQTLVECDTLATELLSALERLEGRLFPGLGAADTVCSAPDGVRPNPAAKVSADSTLATLRHMQDRLYKLISRV
jgi:hypothetical protein